MPPHPIASATAATAAKNGFASGGVTRECVPGPPPSFTAGPPVQLAPPPASALGSDYEKDGAEPAPLWATEQVCRFWRPTSSCLISLVLHALLVILLGLWLTATRGGAPRVALNASMSEGTRDSDTLETQEFESQASSQPVSEAAVSSLEQTSQDLSQSIKADAESEVPAASEPVAQYSDTGPFMPLADGSLAGEVSGGGDADVTGALGGRGRDVRARLAIDGGGTPASEDAVSRGLRWLQAHQLPSGGWRFDLTQGPCEGRCRDSGSEPSSTGATGLALLAFLGRGETHLEGDYQETVKKGLYYLTAQMKISAQGGDLRGEGGGTMYSHGIATIALCEAYAMTQDKALEPFAQKAIDFIVSAQDKRGGGWRYEPQQPGDTTVSGWQLMALKSGQMGYLRVPYETIERAERFLDSVQLENGARYGYQPRTHEGKELTTTSVGLLCRMYTGWPKDRPALQKGVHILAREGPSMIGSSANMYYNYYATQIMHQYGGEEWESWNHHMRDFLTRMQATDGHESGSWYFDGGQAKKGGRLYVTAMAIMTLEVYYRHMPLYAEHAASRW
ncbi:MAG TPA: hypothetical protein VG826_27535 [Pirellulales bacterium]|nr:hypothetical protein [Pirellulales bacterium]